MLTLSFKANAPPAAIQDKRPLSFRANFHDVIPSEAEGGNSDAVILSLALKRLRRLPSEIEGEVLTMSFRARPKAESRNLYFSKNPLNFQPRIGIAATSNNDFAHYPRTIILRG